MGPFNFLSLSLSPASFKKVSWLLGRDGDVHVCVISETDEFKSSKLVLSELREKNENNFNTTNRYGSKTEVRKITGYTSRE